MSVKSNETWATMHSAVTGGTIQKHRTIGRSRHLITARPYDDRRKSFAESGGATQTSQPVRHTEGTHSDL